MGCIINFEAHLWRLNHSNTELESAIITEIQSKKNSLKAMDSLDIYSNTKPDLDTFETIEEKRFTVYDDWYIVYLVTYFIMFIVVIMFKKKLLGNQLLKTFIVEIQDLRNLKLI